MARLIPILETHMTPPPPPPALCPPLAPPGASFTPSTTAVGGSVLLTAAVGLLPLIAFFVLMGVFKVKTHWCALISLAASGLIAVLAFGMPAPMAVLSGAQGLAMGFVPIIYIIIAAVWLYNLTETSGRSQDLKAVFNTIGKGDQRAQALIVAFCFCGLLEGLAGFGAPVPQGARIVTQVQRWDRLKGGLELVEAFASQIDALPADAHLVLVGPRPAPSREAAAARVLGEIVSRAGTLPHAAARRIHVLAVPTTDREVNATIINAIQRISAVVTQRSLVEAFGLTVAEAMWKKAPVVASAVGGIQDQVEDGVSGMLVDPLDAPAWAEAVRDLLLFTERAKEMGDAAHEAVRRRFLPDRHLLEVLDAIGRASE